MTPSMQRTGRLLEELRRCRRRAGRAKSDGKRLGWGWAVGSTKDGFIALWTAGHVKRPNPKARPHDRVVTRVGAQVASQRCPILRAGGEKLQRPAVAVQNSGDH